MKHFNTLLLLVLISASTLFSQDLIITTGGDSIDCRIDNIKNKKIYYSIKHKGVWHNTTIPDFLVVKHELDYLIRMNDSIDDNSKLPQFRAAINIGYSYHPAKLSENVPDVLKEHANKLRSGLLLEGDLSYFITEKLGVGLKASLFNTSSNTDNIQIIYEDGTTEAGTFKSKSQISYIGPSFIVRFTNKYSGNAFVLNASTGALLYKGESGITTTKEFTGITLGSTISASYDIILNKNLLLGFQFGFTLGTLTTLTVKDGQTETKFYSSEDLDEYMSLSRIDLGIGLRFQL